MYSNSQATSYYGHDDNSVNSDNEVEYKIFAKITSALIAARQLSKSDFPKLVRALHDNEKLWVLLAKDVASPGNELPKEIKAQIVYLFEFTLQHSAKIREGSGSIDALIDVNKSIMRGLMKNGGQAV